MTYYTLLVALIAAVGCAPSAHAYLARVENATSDTITVTINLASCAPIQVGALKPGEISKIFDTGACCFDSISAIGTTAHSGNIKPWGSGWLCFQNVHFRCYEMKSGNKVIGIGFQHSNLAR
jgi:hypothetical protein